MKSKSIDYTKGKTWTTDAFYRETIDKTNKRKEQGAVVVDMECSSMAAVAEFRNVKFGQFFYAADNLANEEYDPRSLMSKTLDDNKKKIALLLVECGKYLNERL